jgi:hypothetical protein
VMIANVKSMAARPGEMPRVVRLRCGRYDLTSRHSGVHEGTSRALQNRQPLMRNSGGFGMVDELLRPADGKDQLPERSMKEIHDFRNPRLATLYTVTDEDPKTAANLISQGNERMPSTSSFLRLYHRREVARRLAEVRRRTVRERTCGATLGHEGPGAEGLVGRHPAERADQPRAVQIILV